MAKETTKLFSAVMGKNIVEVNTNQEMEKDVENILDMTFPELWEYLNEEISEPLMKLKIGTILDIWVNIGSYSPEELEKLFGEEEEPE